MTFQSSSSMLSLPYEWSTTPDKSGLGSSPFARRYLGNRCFFLFLGVLRCFSSPGYLLYTYVFSIRYLRITTSEFPHSEICGLTVVCTFPQLIAACHVLRRLLVPRHPPYALIYLTILLADLMYCFVAALLFFIPVHKYIHFSFTKRASHSIISAAQTKLLSFAASTKRLGVLFMISH